MISSIEFRNFKALRKTKLPLGPFNLIIGTNGSGKTTLMQVTQRLRRLLKTPAGDIHTTRITEHINTPTQTASRVTFRFDGDLTDTELHLLSDNPSNPTSDRLEFQHPKTESDGTSTNHWILLRKTLSTARSYSFDHYAMSNDSDPSTGDELTPNGSNLSAVIHQFQKNDGPPWLNLLEDFTRIFPEYDRLTTIDTGNGNITLAAGLKNQDHLVPAEDLSQGTLYMLAYLALAHDATPPALVCIDEVDRGIHPRLLAEVRDALYRLSYPADAGLDLPPTQVIATTHSPYMLDLFKDHPEEIVIAEKRGADGYFTRLSEKPRLSELLSDGSLGDIWYSGILGGVPEQ